MLSRTYLTLEIQLLCVFIGICCYSFKCVLHALPLRDLRLLHCLLFLGLVCLGLFWLLAFGFLLCRRLLKRNYTLGGSFWRGYHCRLCVSVPLPGERLEGGQDGAQDSDAVIAGRMAKSRDEISHWAEYDYVLVNERLEIAEDELKSILRAERLRRDRQPGLSDFVRGLNREFETR